MKFSYTIINKKSDIIKTIAPITWVISLFLPQEKYKHENVWLNMPKKHNNIVK